MSTMIADRSTRPVRLAVPAWFGRLPPDWRRPPAQPDTPAALLALARAYEPTQPSYAADLRAAAQHLAARA